MTTSLIIAWVNGAWDLPGVPKFDETEDEGKSDIKVWFTGMQLFVISICTLI